MYYREFVPEMCSIKIRYIAMKLHCTLRIKNYEIPQTFSIFYSNSNKIGNQHRGADERILLKRANRHA